MKTTKKRKHIVGLNLDFLKLNVLSFPPGLRHKDKLKGIWGSIIVFNWLLLWRKYIIVYWEDLQQLAW